MKKFIAAAVTLTLSTPAHASGFVMINIDRWDEIKVSAQTVCRRAMLPQNNAVKVINDSGIAQGQIDLLESKGA